MSLPTKQLMPACLRAGYAEGRLGSLLTRAPDRPTGSARPHAAHPARPLTHPATRQPASQPRAATLASLILASLRSRRFSWGLGQRVWAWAGASLSAVLSTRRQEETARSLSIADHDQSPLVACPMFSSRATDGSQEQGSPMIGATVRLMFNKSGVIHGHHDAWQTKTENIAWKYSLVHPRSWRVGAP